MAWIVASLGAALVGVLLVAGSMFAPWKKLRHPRCPSFSRGPRALRWMFTRCGYDLSGLAAGANEDLICPECGDPTSAAQALRRPCNWRRVGGGLVLLLAGAGGAVGAMLSSDGWQPYAPATALLLHAELEPTRATWDEVSVRVKSDSLARWQRRWAASLQWLRFLEDGRDYTPLYVLGELGRDARGVLPEMLAYSADPAQQFHLVRALGPVGDGRAAAALLEMPRGAWFECDRVVSLALIGDEAAVPLLRGRVESVADETWVLYSRRFRSAYHEELREKLPSQEAERLGVALEAILALAVIGQCDVAATAAIERIAADLDPDRTNVAAHATLDVLNGRAASLAEALVTHMRPPYHPALAFEAVEKLPIARYELSPAMALQLADAVAAWQDHPRLQDALRERIMFNLSLAGREGRAVARALAKRDPSFVLEP